ncbi:hypothetical protein AJ87_38905 [Rhizobium yanglingense]|nr:hypothetical protein AJ87_38905 [Rhizobium yanglingense]
MPAFAAIIFKSIPDRGGSFTPDQAFQTPSTLKSSNVRRKPICHLRQEMTIMLQDYLSEIASAPLAWMIFLGLAGIVVWHLLSARRANLRLVVQIASLLPWPPSLSRAGSLPAERSSPADLGLSCETIADLRHEKCEGAH